MSVLTAKVEPQRLVTDFNLHMLRVKQLCRKGPGGPGGHQMSQQSALVAKRANGIWGCIRRGAAKQVEAGDPSPLFSTTEATPGVEASVWAPQHKRETDILDRVQ